ncbi:MAG: hypothetical protein JWL73_3482 [Actinomycetia bacterium]|nr:hypothetical protein [Actinomycetes bacterium]
MEPLVLERRDLTSLRVAGAVMLGIGVVRPLLPFDGGAPCPFKAVTGIPCPMCGMTRSVTSVVHGDLGHALTMQPAGIVLVVLAVLLLVNWRLPRRMQIPIWVPAVLIALMWTYNLWKYATGRPT